MKRKSRENAEDPAPKKVKSENALVSNEVPETESGSELNQFRLPNLPGADALYIPKFVSTEDANTWFSELSKLDTWYHPKIKVYGKEVNQSRSIAAYATHESITARYSGHTVDMKYEYPPLLRQIQDRVEERLGVTFNHVMLNWYENGSEYIGKHRDTKENNIIASLSLGAERTFIFSPTPRTASVDGGEVTKLPLGNGSLLVMQGETQNNWKHEIPKEPKVTAGRISLTFRQLQT